MASRAARLLSSSLYLVAALDWYFVLGSLLFSAAVPPFCWKNLVADSLPPTFMTRSWSHCHSGRVLASRNGHSYVFDSRSIGGGSPLRSRFVERTKEMCTPRLRWVAEQSRHR